MDQHTLWCCWSTCRSAALCWPGRLAGVGWLLQLLRCQGQECHWAAGGTGLVRGWVAGGVEQACRASDGVRDVTHDEGTQQAELGQVPQ